MSRDLFNKKKGRTILYTICTFVLLCVMFASLATYLYRDAENRAMENLHVQTKQIKDDLTLQMLSDRENLSTMASFASKLYLDGEDYSLLFESFKPIGLIDNIGILNTDNTFVTKVGRTELKDISFEDELALGSYVSGRVRDITNVNYERVRISVPIVANGETVGILYGIIKLDSIEQRYIGIATELDAQLFIYDMAGDLIVDSIHKEPGNISFLRDRKYNGDYSYEEFATSEKGFTSFQSAYRDEDVLMHYSTLEDLDWKIALVRYDSQVYAETHTLTLIFFIVIAIIVLAMGVFTTALTRVERKESNVIDCASNIRKMLIEASGNNSNITEALKEVAAFTRSRSAIFFDTNGEDYHYSSKDADGVNLSGEQSTVLKAELLRYVSTLTAHDTGTIKPISLRQDSRLEKTAPSVYAMLKDCGIDEIIFLATINHSNHITILAVINPERRADASYLAEKVSACFTIALDNSNILNKTRLAATTDSLTGTLNRVAYNNDLHIINEERPFDFSCIYVDVNELHNHNNKYGHAEGDKMLLYIAHTLKDVFFGQRVYRMGGDEFLVFCRNLGQEDINKSIDIFLAQLDQCGYHVAIGISFRSQNTNTEEMVREAEVRMYEIKAKYYQDKEQRIKNSSENEYVQVKTGIPEIDAMLSILKESYNGIYRVSLDTDSAHRVLMPAYLNYNETEDNFSRLFANYVADSAESDYHRALLSFQNYEALRQQLADGKTPRITYKKLNGEMVTLSVHRLSDTDSVSETLWIFAKK